MTNGFINQLNTVTKNLNIKLITAKKKFVALSYQTKQCNLNDSITG